MSTLNVRYLVVGAGISGLAFADWVGDDDVLVLEAEHDIGGYCRTIVRDGFVWDYSGHFFHFRHPDIERYLVERIECEVRTVRRDSRILYGGGFIDFPFQKNIHQLPKEELLECLYDLHFREEQRTDNFLEMLYAKFGRAIAEKFLVPYNTKLYATDLRRLDADAMGRFFPYADLRDIVRNFKSSDNASYNATFTYPDGGAIEYVRALARGVDPRRIALGERLERIDLRARVASTSSRDIHFERLVSTMPFDRLLARAGLPFERETYTSNKVEVWNLGFDSKGLPGAHWVYVPDPSISFYRVGYYDNILGGERMSLYVELGHPTDAVLPSDEESLARVLSDLTRLGLVRGQQLVASARIVMDPAYVHITRRSSDDVRRRKEVLATCGVYSIGRYGSWTYCSIEDNIVEARALADVFRRADGRHDEGVSWPE